MLPCIIIQGTKYNKLFNKKFDLILRFQFIFKKCYNLKQLYSQLFIKHAV